MLRNVLHDFAVEEGYIRAEATGCGAGAPEEQEAGRESVSRLDQFRERKLTSRR